MAAEHPGKIGRYEVVGLIGKGGMGRVYKAVEPRSNRVVAVKVLSAGFVESEESVERFHREAEAISKLRHRNVVQIIEKVQEDDQLYFVMEYVGGVSLESILRQRRLSLPEAVTVFKGVCQGLEAAHRAQIVHRDLSPRNILVSDDLSTIKIADFGVSRVESISSEMGTLSTSEVSLGTLHYMAPEQAARMVDSDHRSDIYSAGVLLYEMLTGRVPVGRFSLPSQLNSEVPPDVDPMVLRCLEVAPRDRYQSVTALLAELRRLEDRLRLGLVSELKGISRSTTKIIRKSRGSRALQGSLVALALAVLAFAAYYLLQQSAAPGDGKPVSVAAREAADPEPEPTDAPAAENGAQLPGAIATAGEPAEDGGDSEGSADLALAEPEGSEADPGPRTARPRPGVPGPSGRVPAASPAPMPLAEVLAAELDVVRSKIEARLFEPARGDLEKLIETHPQEPATAEAFLLLGQLHSLEDRKAEAKAAYVELRSRFGNRQEALEGVYRMAKLAEAEGRSGRKEARELLTQVVEAAPASQWGLRALLERAALENDDRVRVFDDVLGTEVPAELVSLRALIRDHPAHPGAEDAWWKLGELYSDLKRFDLAAAAYEELGTRFPSTSHDAWWSAAQIRDRRLDEEEKAIELYKKVPETSRHHKDARKRLAKLSR